jgi:predicted permease
VGVAQPGFRLPLDREVFGWRPFVPEPWENAFADYPDYQVAGWLAPGVDPTAAAGELSSLVPEPTEPQFAGLTVRLAGLEELYRPQDGGVLALLGAVSVVLLLGCLNTAQLLVARGVGKSGELAVRMALGSRPGAVGRGHLNEAGLLAGAGTMAGVLLALLLLRIFVAVDPGHLPGWADVRITTRVVAYLAGVATVATLLAGWLPARLASRISPAASLVPGRGITANRSRGLAQWVLLAAQTASAVVVLAGSGLLVRSWLAVQAVDPGIDAARVHAGRVVLPSDRYNPGDGAEHIRFFDALRQRVEAEAGVASAAVATSIPMASGLDFDQPFRPEADASARTVDVSTRLISPGYFSTLGIRIVAGRTVEITDDADAERVAIVSEAAARLAFGAAPDDVVGQILIEPSERGDARYRIIGVAADVRDDGLERTPPPKVYLPWQQSRPFGRMWLIVRSDLESPIAFERVKAALRDVDAELPLVDATPMTDLVARSVAARRFNLLLLAALGLLALAVATAGVAGLVAFSVSSRRREVGIRVALGASPASVVATTIAPAFGALATGVAAGAVAAGLLTELARGLLFGVEPLDAWSLALASGTLLGAGVVAALACARAAVRSDPLTALNAG